MFLFTLFTGFSRQEYLEVLKARKPKWFASPFSSWPHFVTLAPWKKSDDKPRQHIKRQRHHFANKGLYSQSYGISSSHVWMWEFNHKEGWVLKNWCFWIVVLEKILQSPVDSKEINPVHPKGNQPWIFIQRTDAEAPILRPPDAKSWLPGKDPDAGKGWGQKGVTEDEWLDGITDSMDMSLSKLREIVGNGEAWRAAVLGVTKSGTRLGDWTTTRSPECSFYPGFFSYPLSGREERAC